MIQDEYLIMNKYACLALCYSWIANHNSILTGYGLDVFMTKQVMEGKLKGYLDDEYSVKDAAAYLHFCSPLDNFSVGKKDITSIKDIKQATPVRYDYNGHSHWVVVEDGAIVFNSLSESQCVKHGKPVTSRVITWR